MKKIIWIIVLILLILIIPIPGGQYKDGGTKEYKALTYRIVVWNRLIDEGNTYHRTTVFWFPRNFKHIDELWKLTYGENMENTDSTAADMNALKEKYPEYFGLSAAKGLEVYVWQMAPDSYSFGVLPGTNREKTSDELWDLKGASAEEMRIILSTYDIEESDIFVIPWQNPISSFISEYWIRLKDEDPASAAKRQQEYMDKVRAMLFDPGSTAG